MGWNYLNSRIPLSSLTYNQWSIKDLTNIVGENTQAIMVNILFGNSISAVGVRAVGDSYDLKPTLRNYGQRLMIIPLDNKMFSYYIASASNSIFIVAESDDKIGLVQSSLTDFFGGTINKYVLYTPPDLPSDAEIALVNIYDTSTSSYQVSLEEAGDPIYGIYANQLTVGFAPVTYSSFNYKQSSTNMNGYYAGYLPYAKKCKRESHQLSQTGWNQVTASSVSDNASLVLLNIHVSNSCKMMVRNVGSSDNPGGYQNLASGGQIWWMVNLNSSKQFEVYTDDATPSNVTVEIIGYMDYTIYKTIDQLEFALSLGTSTPTTITKRKAALEMEIEAN